MPSQAYYRFTNGNEVPLFQVEKCAGGEYYRVYNNGVTLPVMLPRGSADAASIIVRWVDE